MTIEPILIDGKKYVPYDEAMAWADGRVAQVHDESVARAAKAAALSPWEKLREAAIDAADIAADTYDLVETLVGMMPHLGGILDRIRAALRAVEGVAFLEDRRGWLRCSGCGEGYKVAIQTTPIRYCPYCGAPITEWRAWKDEEAKPKREEEADGK